MTTINKKCNQPNKQKPSSEKKPTKANELQALTLAELDAVAGAGLTLGNHNETVVKFENLPQKQKPFSGKPSKVNELQTLTVAELDAITAGVLLFANPFA